MMPPSFLGLIWQRWYPDNTAESRVESTFRSKATTARQLSQRTTSGTEKFFGIFHTIRVHKFLQITTEVFVHYIAQIGLVCFKQCTQFLQRKRNVKKYLTYLKLVQYSFIYYNPPCECLFPFRQTPLSIAARQPWKAKSSVARK